MLGDKEVGIAGKRRNWAGHVNTLTGLGIGLWKREESGILVGINQILGFCGLGLEQAKHEWHEDSMLKAFAISRIWWKAAMILKLPHESLFIAILRQQFFNPLINTCGHPHASIFSSEPLNRSSCIVTTSRLSVSLGMIIVWLLMMKLMSHVQKQKRLQIMVGK